MSIVSFKSSYALRKLLSLPQPKALLLASLIGLPILPVAAHAQEDISAFPGIVDANQDVINLHLLDPELQSEPFLEQRVVGYVGTLDAEKFPGILQFRSNGARICTAAIVGPQALLTAAHCLGSRNYSIALENQQIGMRCYYSNSYNRGIRDSNDWALCKLDHRVPGTLVDTYETLDIENRPQPGQPVMLTGFGCTVEDGPSAHRLLYGFAETIEYPSNWPKENTAFLTQAVVGDPINGASLCAGDSGGPAFSAAHEGQHHIVGVNSRVNYTTGVSWFSATASRTGIRFFRAWIKAMDTPICGLNYEGERYELNCRS